MKKEGKFILYTIGELKEWLTQTKFNRSVRLIQNHHTLIPSYKDFNGTNHFALVKSMENYHVTQRGFDEIAQNITTFPDGTAAICRSLEKIPAGIRGANQYGICIEHLGNFDLNIDTMRVEHADAIVKLNALLCWEFGMSPNTDTIVYHHWYDLNTGQRLNGAGVTKSCPGTNYFSGNKVEDAMNKFIPHVVGYYSELKSCSPVTIPQPIKTGEITATSLRVRNSPATHAAIVKSLSKGIVVSIYVSSGDWYKIHPAEEHWIYGKYVKIIG